MKTEKIDITAPCVRGKFEKWIKERGGVQVWNNLNLSNPDAGQQFTPALTEDDKEYQKPTGSVAKGEVIQDIGRFRFVERMEEFKRFRVAVRRGSQGLSMKVTDGGSRRIRKECTNAREKYGDSYYRFDYSTQEAVIEVPVWEGDNL